MYFEPAAPGGACPHAAPVLIDAAGIHAGAAQLRFAGARPGATIEPESPLAGVSNYFHGRNAGRSRTGVPHYGRLRIHGLYPATDVVLYGRGGKLEFDYVLAPGARVDRIAIDFRGSPVHLKADGDLEAGVIVQRRPKVFQNGRELQSRYALSRHGRVRIRVDGADPRHELLVDPVLDFQTYLGGRGHDVATAVALDGGGNIYIGGETTSTDFPVTPNAPQSNNAGGYDVFLAKLDPTGSKLLYATYLGGSLDDSDRPPIGDSVRAIAVDAAGNLYATGGMRPDFPLTPGSYRSSPYAYVLKLDASGSRLVYSASVPISTTSIAVNASGVVYAAGSAFQLDFRGTAGAFQTGFAGGTSDGAVVALNAAGSDLVFSTLLGGNGRDGINTIALDASGQVYVAGQTTSTDFPVTTGASLQGGSDGFVARLDAAGSRLGLSALVGGQADDEVTAITLDKSGSPILLSAGSKFPNAKSLDGATPIMSVSRMKQDGSLDWGSGIGCSCRSIAIDAKGHLYTAGSVSTLLLSGGTVSRPYNSSRLFKISPAGDAIEYLTGLDEPPSALAVTAEGAAVAVSSTYSSGLGTPGAVQPDKPPKGAPNRYYVPTAALITRIDTSDAAGNNFFVELPRDVMLFEYRIGDVAQPKLPVINVTSAAGPLPIEAVFSEPWLSATVDGSTPTKVRLALNAGALTAGSLKGTLAIRSPGLPYGPVQLPVTAVIAERPAYTIVGVHPLAMSAQLGITQYATATFPVQVSPSGSNYSFNVTSTAAWLSGNVGYGSSGYELRVFAGTSQMQPGTYKATLSVSMVGVENSPQIIDVTFLVSAAPNLTLSTTSMVFTHVAGRQTPPPQVLHIGTDSPGALINLHNGETYVDLNCKFELSSTTAPADMTISINPKATMGSGRYQCPIDIGLTSAGYTRVWVWVYISKDVPLEAVPAEISYSMVRGSQYYTFPTLVLVGNANTAFTMKSDQKWLSLPATGRAPADIYLPFDDLGLAEGVHKATITITPQTGPVVNVPVSFDVRDKAQLKVSTNLLTFNYRQGDPAPPPQSVSVTSTSIYPATLNYGLFSAAWMKAEPTAYATPADVKVTIDPKGLDPGTYTAGLVFYGAVGNGRVDIVLNVVPQAMAVRSVVNAASFQPGEMQPGEIVTIFGSGLGPATLAPGSLDANGMLATSAGGARVLFDDTPAPILYASSGQTRLSRDWPVMAETSKSRMRVTPGLM